MKLLKHASAAFAVLFFVAVWVPQVALAQDDDDDALDEFTDDADDAMDSAIDSVDDASDAASDATEAADDSMKMMESSSAGRAMERRLVLPKGQVYLQGFMEINLSKGGFFKPIWLQPDVWYGYSSKLTFGLVHSSRALNGFLSSTFPSGGLCLGSTTAATGETFVPCPRGTYSGTGLLARYHVLDSPVILALDGGLIFADLSPFVASLKLGVSGEWNKENLHVLFGMNLGLGLNKRDEGNKEILNLPIGVMYDIMPKLTAGVQTGFRIPFSNTGDTYSIPLGFGGRYVVSPKLTVDASFSFPVLLGGNAGKLNARVLTLGAAYVL